MLLPPLPDGSPLRLQRIVFLPPEGGRLEAVPNQDRMPLSAGCATGDELAGGISAISRWVMQARVQTDIAGGLRVTQSRESKIYGIYGGVSSILKRMHE
jgi:hypothetical protein